MLKRVLHAANQVVTHEETHTGKELVIENTVNAPAEVRVRGDSWQRSTTGAQLFPFSGTVDTVNFTATIEKNEITIISKVSSSDIIIITLPIDVKAGETYIFMAEYEKGLANIDVIKSDGTREAVLNRNKPFTAKEGYIYKAKIYLNPGGGKVDIGDTRTYRNVMFNAGSSVLPWEPYTGNAPSPSPEYPQDIISVSGTLKSTNNSLGGRDKLRESQIVIPELRAIPGTDVRDELVVYPDGTGKIVRRVKNRHLSPDDNFGNSGLSTDETKNFLLKSIVDFKRQMSWNITNASCNIANTGKVQGFNVANTVFAGGSNSDILYICVSSEVASTVEEFKDLVASKDIYVNYEIEPIEEPITADQIQGILRTHQYHTEISFEGLDEHLDPEVEVKCRVLGR